MINLMHRIRAITLDLDDTLWEIDPVIRRAEAKLWQWLCDNYPRVPETFAADDLLALRATIVERYWEKSHDFYYLRKKVLEIVARESGYSPELAEPAFEVFDRARNEVAFYPDVLPGLEWLARDFSLVAVTNGNANLDVIGIRHLFNGVVTAAGAGAAKPARPIFEQAIAACNAKPEEILHVGDHPETDIVGAQQVGMRTAWMNRKGEEWPSELHAPDAVVATIAGLHELLEPARAAINGGG